MAIPFKDGEIAAATQLMTTKKKNHILNVCSRMIQQIHCI